MSNPQILGAYYAQNALEERGQIQWEDLRSANATIPEGFARYAVYEDIKQVKNTKAVCNCSTTRDPMNSGIPT